MPSTTLNEELKTIESVVKMTNTRRILILGDLVHSVTPLHEKSEEEVRAWRKRPSICDLQIELIKGNHDKFKNLPESWHMRLLKGNLREGPFNFAHAPVKENASGVISWYGHIHPVFKMRYRREFVRTPCFVLGKSSVLLPAFGLSTEGHEIKRHEGDRILAVAGGQILEL